MWVSYYNVVSVVCLLTKNKCIFFSICRFGRRFAVLISLLLLLLFSVGSAFSPNIYVYMVIRFFVGGSGGVIVMNSSVMGRYNVWLKTLSLYKVVQVSKIGLSRGWCVVGPKLLIGGDYFHDQPIHLWFDCQCKLFSSTLPPHLWLHKHM